MGTTRNTIEPIRLRHVCFAGDAARRPVMALTPPILCSAASFLQTKRRIAPASRRFGCGRRKRLSLKLFTECRRYIRDPAPYSVYKSCTQALALTRVALGATHTSTAPACAEDVPEEHRVLRQDKCRTSGALTRMTAVQNAPAVSCESEAMKHTSVQRASG